MSNVIALIPARHGSKGIPKKNIIKFRNKPLLAHSIEYAKKCKLINDIIVSTDSKEIAEIANSYGARTPFLRPKIFSGDYVQDFPVLNHALKFLEKETNKEIDFIALLRPTSPLRPKNLIEKAYDLIKTNKLATSVRTVVKSEQHPFRQFMIKNKKMISFIDDVKEPYNIPRQRLPVSFFQSGDLEFIKRKTIMSGSVSGNYIIPLIIKSEELFDIDYLSDLNKKPNIKAKN